MDGDVRTRLAALGVAFPDAVEQETLWAEYFSARAAGLRSGRAAFATSGVVRRHAAFDPRKLDVSSWSTAKRMASYPDAALPLARAAVDHALSRAGVAARDVGLLALSSCTGHGAPGLDVLLARELGIAPDARRLLVGHVGCHAALPTLAAADDYVARRGRPALVVSVELSSLHLQPPPDDTAQAIIHALFSDGAAAAVLVPDSPAAGARGGLLVVDHEAASELSASAAMTWQIGDHGFVMQLSRRVPALVGALATRVVDALLARHELTRADVHTWAIHPGGPRLVEVAATALGLDDAAMAPALGVLAEHGNCSSATVLVVLEEALRRSPPSPGGVVLALAFGPGLTCYGTLLRAPG